MENKTSKLTKPEIKESPTRKDLIKNCLSTGPKQFKEIMDFLDLHNKGLKSRTSLFKQLDKMMKEDLITKIIPENNRYPVYSIVRNSVLDVEMNSNFFREEVNGEMFTHVGEIIQEIYQSNDKRKISQDSKFVKALIEYFGFFILFALLEGVKAPMMLSKKDKMTEAQFSKRLQVWLKNALSLEDSIISPSVVFKNLVNELTKIDENWEEKKSAEVEPDTGSIIGILQRLRDSLEKIYPNTFVIAKRGETSSYEHSKKINEITNTHFL